MQYLALATDYDGTLATDGRVDHATVDSLRKLHDSGRKILLVTGRQLPELPRADLPGVSQEPARRPSVGRRVRGGRPEARPGRVF